MEALNFQTFLDVSTGDLIEVESPQDATVDYLVKQIEDQIGYKVKFFKDDQGSLYPVMRDIIADLFFRNCNPFRPIPFESTKPFTVQVIVPYFSSKDVVCEAGESVADVRERASRLFSKNIAALTFEDKILPDRAIFTSDTMFRRFPLYATEKILDEVIAVSNDCETPAVFIKFKNQNRKIDINHDDCVADFLDRLRVIYPDQSNLQLVCRGKIITNFSESILSFLNSPEFPLEVITSIVKPIPERVSTVRVRFGMNVEELSITRKTCIADIKAALIEIHGIFPEEGEITFIYEGRMLPDTLQVESLIRSAGDSPIHAVLKI